MYKSENGADSENKTETKAIPVLWGKMRGHGPLQFDI